MFSSGKVMSAMQGIQKRTEHPQTVIPREYDDRTFADFIGRTARRALYTEALVSPKPGLVDQIDSGAHKDMDIELLFRSADTLEPFFVRLCEGGIHCSTPIGTGHGPNEAFRAVRKIGIEAEQAMFEATCGVNTHKGAVFTLGLFCTAAGYLKGAISSGRIQRDGKLDPFKSPLKILDCASEMVQGIVNRELDTPSPGGKTAGEKLYNSFGLRGIRGEAEDGFPALRRMALPVLREGFRRMRSGDNPGGAEAVYLHVLLNLMTIVEDTNVVSRGGLEALRCMRKEAREALNLGGAYSAEGLAYLWEMNKRFIRRNISPGGCADLLSAALFLREIQ